MDCLDSPSNRSSGSSISSLVGGFVGFHQLAWHYLFWWLISATFLCVYIYIYISLSLSLCLFYIPPTQKPSLQVFVCSQTPVTSLGFLAKGHHLSFTDHQGVVQDFTVPLPPVPCGQRVSCGRLNGTK